ncbi:NPCBM/NEW2 domain-containing protein [Streptomyces sp. ZAF1911]|uniref:NPCBM/NEW2 domain-containing protein n=1 Tax=Streptomyces sp. ZAF1911 TaxID=2944129 RepID=UPI00237ABEBA|nr:NPCBM/NEW2 domain-containing protein [Streptomyces sp. ZAF1911]MDD9380864.1 NPCBM/NEW2 domain-containing protein [Streptomyces sp. ZAF1911]
MAALVSALAAVLGVVLGFLGLPVVFNSPTARTAAQVVTPTVTATVTVTAPAPGPVGSGAPSGSAQSPGATAPVFTPPAGPTVSLVGLAPSESRNDPYSAGPKKVNLEEYPKTLSSVCAESTWQLDRKYESFVARIGATDDAGSRMNFTFEVAVDGKSVEVGKKRAGEPVTPVTVDLRGAFRLTLKAGDCYSSTSSGAGVWIDPVLTPKA